MIPRIVLPLTKLALVARVTYMLGYAWNKLLFVLTCFTDAGKYNVLRLHDD